MSNELTPLGQPGSGETAPSSVELPVNVSFFGKIWATPIVKEFVLFVGLALAIQIGGSLNVLQGALEDDVSWSERWVTLKTWWSVFTFSITGLAGKQLLAFIAARLAGTKL